MMKMANLTLIVGLMSLLCVANGFFEGHRVSPTFYGTGASCPPVTCATCGPGEGNYYFYVDGCRHCACKPSTRCQPMPCSTCPPGQAMRYEYTSSGCPYCYCTNPANTGCPTTIPLTCQPGAYVSCNYGSYCSYCYCLYDATTYPPYGSTYPSYQGTTPPTICPICPDGYIYTPPYPNCNCQPAVSTPQSSAGLPKSRLLDMIMNVERNAMAVEQLAKNLESEAKFVYDLIQTSYINNRARRDAGEE